VVCFARRPRLVASTRRSHIHAAAHGATMPETELTAAMTASARASSSWTCATMISPSRTSPVAGWRARLRPRRSAVVRARDVPGRQCRCHLAGRNQRPPGRMCQRSTVRGARSPGAGSDGVRCRVSFVADARSVHGRNARFDSSVGR